MKKTISVLALSCLAMSSVAIAADAYTLLSINFGDTAVDGWTQVTQSSGANLSTTLSDSNGTQHTLKITCSGGNITVGNFQTITATSWLSVSGGFDGSDTSLADMGQAIGKTVGTGVWNTGIANGGYAGTALTIGGFDSSKTYNVWLIGGSNKTDFSADDVYGWSLASTNIGESTTVKYDYTGRTEGTGYIDVTNGAVTSNKNIANLIKMTNVVVDEDGNIKIALNGGQRASLNALVIQEVTSVPEPATATLSLLALAGLCARRRRK